VPNNNLKLAWVQCALLLLNKCLVLVLLVLLLLNKCLVLVLLVLLLLNKCLVPFLLALPLHNKCLALVLPVLLNKLLPHHVLVQCVCLPYLNKVHVRVPCAFPRYNKVPVDHLVVPNNKNPHVNLHLVPPPLNQLLHNLAVQAVNVNVVLTVLLIAALKDQLPIRIGKRIKFIK